MVRSSLSGQGTCDGISKINKKQGTIQEGGASIPLAVSSGFRPPQEPTRSVERVWCPAIVFFPNSLVDPLSQSSRVFA